MFPLSRLATRGNGRRIRVRVGTESLGFFFFLFVDFVTGSSGSSSVAESFHFVQQIQRVFPHSGLGVHVHDGRVQLSIRT